MCCAIEGDGINIELLAFMYSLLKLRFFSHFLTFSNIFKIQIYFNTLLIFNKKFSKKKINSCKTYNKWWCLDFIFWRFSAVYFKLRVQIFIVMSVCQVRKTTLLSFSLLLSLKTFKVNIHHENCFCPGEPNSFLKSY